jgi:hypothetical protein
MRLQSASVPADKLETSGAEFWYAFKLRGGPSMKQKPVRKNSVILGVLLIIAGILGLMLPVLPGWLLILVSLNSTGRAR